MTRAPAPGGLLAHGMGREAAEPDWAPLTTAEVTGVLSRYDLPGAGAVPGGIQVTWRSPRPFSAAALVRWAGHAVFVKRHHHRVRTGRQLLPEHAFARHLASRGLPVPAVLKLAGGGTAFARGGFVYEVHEVAAGVDLYRDAVSWSPFASAGHAWAAGATLARLHRAASGFGRPQRPLRVLVGSAAIVSARDPLGRVGALLTARPSLAGYLRGRDWRGDLAHDVLPMAARAAPLLARLPRRWGHGDWHPSNLTWSDASGGARVAGIFDFGLANRTFAVHDLAVALERSTVAWLDLAESGRAGVDLPAVDALLAGYEAVRPLAAREAAALPAVLPVAHAEFALSETEYFAGVLGSVDLADLAYHTYLLGHARWFRGRDGSALLRHLRAWAARPGRPGGAERCQDTGNAK